MKDSQIKGFNSIREAFGCWEACHRISKLKAWQRGGTHLIGHGLNSGLFSCRPVSKPATRSIGVNAVASREQEPDPVPPWEKSHFPPTLQTGPSIWQELCAEAGDSVTTLLSADAAENFGVLLRSNAAALPDGYLSAVQTEVRANSSLHPFLPLYKEVLLQEEGSFLHHLKAGTPQVQLQCIRLGLCLLYFVSG